ncbi:MAG: methionyl-tRNA formyltransferase [Bacillota bacterium]
MNVVFMGSPEFAIAPLQALARVAEVRVITRPEKPKGRGRKPMPTPVAEAARELGLFVYTPANRQELVQMVKQLAPELVVTAAYGVILPEDVLRIPPLGCVNIHPSLLPEYRGPAPIHRAIMDGKEITGVTLYFMNECMDAGDIIARHEVPVGDRSRGELEAILSRAGASLLLANFDALCTGTAERIPQRDEEASYAAAITPEEERIDWYRPAEFTARQIRALDPTPGAYTLFSGRKLKLFGGRFITRSHDAEPGSIIRADAKGGTLQIAGTGGIVSVDEVQPEGKRRMKVLEFLRGYRAREGTVLGWE